MASCILHVIAPVCCPRSGWIDTCSFAAGLCQILAVDVLTGKSTELGPKTTLRLPSELEDKRICKHTSFVQACCATSQLDQALSVCRQSTFCVVRAAQICVSHVSGFVPNSSIYLHPVHGHASTNSRMCASSTITFSRSEHHVRTQIRPQSVLVASLASSCRSMGLPHLRYDSVKGIHPTGNTPICITYHEARGYPNYLITYS